MTHICERCGEPVVLDGLIWRIDMSPATSTGAAGCQPRPDGGWFEHEVPTFPDFHDLPAVEQWLAS